MSTASSSRAINRGLLRQALVSDRFAGGLIFVIALAVFWLSPVHQLTDSNYSMLLSESLLRHRTFTLDAYKIPRLEPRYHDNTFKNGEMYQLELVGPHLYYYMPPGSSVLSLPYVALLNGLGVSAAHADGSYNSDNEEIIETSLAAVLMALFAGLVFFTARLVLSRGWSALIALAAAFATPVWSTASRALWSDTWAVFLLGLVVWMLIAHETKNRPLKPVVLASLLAWSYFVRPTNVISIVAITVYLLIRERRYFALYAITGALWFAAFAGYSWYNFHQLLPKYFLANRLSFNAFGTAFAGNLVSPSRGLFIFVPLLLFVIYLLIVYRKSWAFPRLMLMALVIITLHLIVIAGFTPWNGGFAYGPRYTTGLVPWFVLLATAGIAAMLSEQADTVKRSPVRIATLGVGGVLLLAGIMLNGRGAIAQETWVWNKWPTNVDTVPGKVWDWRQPQFLAGLIHPPLPREFPLLTGRVEFTSPAAEKFLWYGWSGSEPFGHWSAGNEAAVIFALNDLTGDYRLQIQMAPFLVPGKLVEQKVDIFCNGVRLQHFVLRDDLAQPYALNLAKEILKDKNILVFRLEDAAAPKSFGLSSDIRRLAVRVEWIQVLR